MARIILVTSGKGGVGKSTLVANLAASLAQLGQDVIAVDANLTTPNLGLHLGMHLAPKTLHDVLKGENLRNAIYSHPLGFRVIPASMNVYDLQNVDVGKLPEVTFSLINQADYVLLDSSAGLGREAISAIAASNEILVVTNPDLPSVADALKTIKIAESTNKNILGVILNRRKGKWHELTTSEVEEMLGHQVISEIPEDSTVQKSIFSKDPIVNLDPKSPASIEMRRLAHNLVGKPFSEEQPSPNLLHKLISWILD